MFELNTSGYDLVDLGDDLWGFNVRGGELSFGAFAETILKAISMGLTFEALEEGVSMMVRKDHDSAHFGMFGTVIFTFNRGEDYGRKAS